MGVEAWNSELHPQASRAVKSLQVGERMLVWGKRCTPAPLDRDSGTRDPSGPNPTYLFTWLFISVLCNILYTRPVSMSVSCPEFCEPFQQITNPKKGVWGHSWCMYSSLVRSIGDLDLRLASGVGVLQPVASGLTPGS